MAIKKTIKNERHQVIHPITEVSAVEGLSEALAQKQDVLNSGVNLKTINGESLLGPGNMIIDGGGSTISVDTEMSDTSENPVQNKVITQAISGFITKSVDDLVNYYLKSETYNKTEVDSLIAAVNQFTYEVAASLPTASASTMYKIYLIPSSRPETQNVKDEYITIRSGSEGSYTYSWEQIGSTAIDLSDYVTTSALNAALASYTTTAQLNTLLAAKQDVINDLSTIRSGAAAGATAYQKPSGGIPKTDLNSGVQASLDLADSAVQADPVGSVTPPVTPSDWATAEQVEELEADVEGLENKTEGTILHSKNLADFASVMEGMYPASNGEIGSNANSTSLKFPCKPLTTYTVSKTLTNRFRICYFNTEPIVGATGGGVITSNAATSLSITTAADSEYIVIYVNDSSVEGSKTISEILQSLQIEIGSEATEYEQPYWTAVDRIARKNVESIGDILNNPINGNKVEVGSIDRFRTDFIKHDVGTNLIDISKLGVGYINAQGEVVENQGFRHTDFVRVNAGEQLFEDLLWTGYYAFYDSQKNLIEGHGNDDSIVGKTFTVPDGAYFGRFTIDPSVTTYDNKIWINTTNSRPYPYKDSISEELLPEKTFCNYDGSEISVFNKILCIGDSLTEGVFNHRDSGHTEYETYPKYSYPTFLQKLTNVECTNKGVASMTSVQWYDYFQNRDIWGGYDAAIIQLGVNDAGVYSGWSQESETAFINIINKLQTENNNIKIFVATIMPVQSYSGANYDAVSAGIRSLVAALDNPNVILVDMAEYSHTGDSAAYDCGHLSAIGYHRLAQDYKNIISYYISRHLTDFQEVQFIGTDYWYNNPNLTPN